VFSQYNDLSFRVGEGRKVHEILRRERSFPLMLYTPDENGNPIPDLEKTTIVWFGRPGFQRMGEVMVNYLGPLIPIPYEQTFGTELYIDLKRALSHDPRELSLFVPDVFQNQRRAA